MCPRCGGLDRITTVKGGRIGLYRRGLCKRQFTVTVGTVFESSHVPLNQWLQAVYLMCSSKKGISSHQLEVRRGKDGHWFAPMTVVVLPFHSYLISGLLPSQGGAQTDG